MIIRLLRVAYVAGTTISIVAVMCMRHGVLSKGVTNLPSLVAYVKLIINSIGDLAHSGRRAALKDVPTDTTPMVTVKHTTDVWNDPETPIRQHIRLSTLIPAQLQSAGNHINRVAIAVSTTYASRNMEIHSQLGCEVGDENILSFVQLQTVIDGASLRACVHLTTTACSVTATHIQDDPYLKSMHLTTVRFLDVPSQ